MFRTVRVGKGLFKKTLSYAISNAKFGDKIIIEDIDMSKETQKKFIIPKNAMIDIVNEGNSKIVLKDYKFEIYGCLSISNIDFELSQDEKIFTVTNGYLSLYSVEFKNIPKKSKKFPIYIYDDTKLSVIDSSISIICSKNSKVKLSQSNIYGGSVSLESEWIIEKSHLNNKYMADQFTIRDSIITIKDSRFIAYPDIVIDNAPILSLKNSKLIMENSEMTANDTFDLTQNYLMQGINSTSITLKKSKIDSVYLLESNLYANNFETSFLFVTENSILNISSLFLDKTISKKHNSIQFNNNSYGEIHLVNPNISEIKMSLNNSKLILTLDKNIDNVSVYKDSNSEIQSDSSINVINTDKKKQEKKENQIAKSVNNSETSNKQENTNAMDELKNLVGLANAKRQAIEFITTHKVNKLKKQKGLNVESTTLHSVYKGNPGTGKTTVARLIAKILAQENVIKKDLLVEVTRQDLVANYVGQTAPKTESVLKSALGGVLFIDEAYRLYRKSENDYGIEAIETILKFMEDNRDNIMIIFAGYTKEMDDLISMNPGLESRIQNEIVFEDYTISEMMLIGEKMLSEYTFNKEVYELKLREKFEQQKVNGNARFIRNLNDKILRNQSNRIFEDNVMDEEYNLIRDVDIEKI
ncbi:AAA family ATPase [Staphylococcus warneri]|uniref:AAA family ATPase n=1 Tax=Staphylococcus warneri TaxID=1292 RepID=UPI0034CE81EA